MHSSETRHEFLRLRLQGLSFARIGRQLGVSKPTLIKWSRQSQTQLDALSVEDQQRMKQEITASANDELAELNRKLNVLRQELISRALHDTPTSHLETLLGEVRHRIQHLESSIPQSGTS